MKPVNFFRWLVLWFAFTGFTFAVAISPSASALESELPALAAWPQIAKTLALQETVQKKIDEQLYLYERNMIDLKTELKKQRLELSRALHATSMDEAKINSLSENLGHIEMRIRKAQLGLWIELKRALSAEQFDKLSQWLEASRKKG